MDKSSSQHYEAMPSSLMSDRKPLIIGHRGAAGLAPENTLPAFEAALNAGADGVEFDVQRTVDGHLIVFHDEDVARTSDGNGLMPQMTLEEMKTLDVGSWFDEDFATTHVLTLAELFDWICDKNLLLFLELKEPFRFPGIESEVARLLHEYDLVDRTQVRSFYHEHLHILNQIAPDISISQLWYQYIPQRDEITYPTHNLSYNYCTEEHISRFHEWGLKVTAWVVNDIEAAHQLKMWGIDGITTDDPIQLQAIFSE
jgi:glycerophosphoryl diester phosphodiesterase